MAEKNDAPVVDATPKETAKTVVGGCPCNIDGYCQNCGATN